MTTAQRPSELVSLSVPDALRTPFTSVAVAVSSMPGTLPEISRFFCRL